MTANADLWRIGEKPAMERPASAIGWRHGKWVYPANFSTCPTRMEPCGCAHDQGCCLLKYGYRPEPVVFPGFIGGAG
jgi:hypothetical protein